MTLHVNDTSARGFQELYERVYGETIEVDRAREMARRLLTLYELLLRPLPTPQTPAIEGDSKTSPSPSSNAE